MLDPFQGWKQHEENKMKFNWPLVGISILFWGCVWLFGFFQTAVWSVIITATIGIYLRLSKKI